MTDPHVPHPDSSGRHPEPGSEPTFYERLSTGQRATLGTIAGLVAVAGLGAILAVTGVFGGDEGDDVVVDPGTTVASSTTAPTTTAVPGNDPDATDPSATLATTTTEPTTTSSSEPTTSETTDPEDGPDYVDFDRRQLEREPLVVLANGVELVRYSEPTDLDCDRGTLVAETDVGVLRIYDEFFEAGGLRAHQGPFDSVALVANCEESLLWVGFVANVDTSGANRRVEAPDIELVSIPIGIWTINDMGWIGNTGYFGGRAELLDGSAVYEDFVVMSPESLGVELADGAIGNRQTFLDGTADLIVPYNWSVVVDDEIEALVESDDSDAYLRVTRTDVELPAPAPVAGEQVFAEATHRQFFWNLFADDYGDEVAATTSAVDGVEIVFESTDGLRYVRQAIDAGTTWEIEYFVPASEGLAFIDVPGVSADTVRIFTEFG